jgi:hypothetical protein
MWLGREEKGRETKKNKGIKERMTGKYEMKTVCTGGWLATEEGK